MEKFQEHHSSKEKPSNSTSRIRWIAGVAFTFLIALVSFMLAEIPVLQHIGPLACAIFIAIMYRQLFGYPEAIRQGIQFSAKRLLRLAIILFGLKLNINLIIHQGMGILLRDACVIAFAIAATVLAGKLLKAEASLTLLLGVGTGICGAAAIAAVSPILKAKEEDTAMSVGIIALIGTIFSIVYTFIRPILSISALHYGIWSGISLHEIAQVALAGAPAGPNALAVALMAKLGRVLLLIPVCFIFMFWIKRKNADSESKARIEFPWFLVGFIAMSLFGSYVLGKTVHVPNTVLVFLSNATTFILTSAMVGLGLNVSLNDLRTRALRPLAAMTITSILLSILTFFIA
ncbi:YeiH family protein [Heyndrickxia acidicola]|uniref:YeiH family protein n=1 Tax=Heyndrickxia acidicola TaxID=209389 RepID=A0ABU6MEA6_9BACI|nr:YeiH family protein [Heyndrickxia acidicola]MED1203005.1 YeiH family protein [Heyndrickxia acidicola]